MKFEFLFFNRKLTMDLIQMIDDIIKEIIHNRTDNYTLYSFKLYNSAKDLWTKKEIEDVLYHLSFKSIYYKNLFNNYMQTDFTIPPPISLNDL